MSCRAIGLAERWMEAPNELGRLVSHAPGSPPAGREGEEGEGGENKRTTVASSIAGFSLE
eukprot:scaffold270084_cov33-Tisochrysis_lutea.AAC.1